MEEDNPGPNYFKGSTVRAVVILCDLNYGSSLELNTRLNLINLCSFVIFQKNSACKCVIVYGMYVETPTSYYNTVV